MKWTLFLAGILFWLPVHAEPAKNLVLVTADGIRWQELFRGIDKRLLEDERYTKHPDTLMKTFYHQDSEKSRSLLFPFFWETIEKQGVMLGNRDIGSQVQLTNNWYFSYPGYNEILTGRADPSIDSNKPTPNPNVTFLEWLHRMPEFKGRVNAFGSWDVFPAIINEERSKIPVNAGFENAPEPLSDKERLLNDLQADTPSPWHNVRLDAFTHHYALETLRKHQPRVTYIAYGETDDFAHDGDYDQYIAAARRFDGFIEELWEYLQANDAYRGNTVLVIATDHGRGELPLEGWQHHGSMRAFKSYLSSPAMNQFKNGIEGAEHTWFAAIGPGVRAVGSEQLKGDWYNTQVAATALRLLGFDASDYHDEAGAPIKAVLTVGDE